MILSFLFFIPAIAIQLGSQVSLVWQWEEKGIVVTICSDGELFLMVPLK